MIAVSRVGEEALPQRVQRTARSPAFKLASLPIAERRSNIEEKLRSGSTSPRMVSKSERGQPMAMPKWRPFSWVILVINILFLVWIIVGIAASKPTDCGSLTAEQCSDVNAVGTGIGVAIIIVFWAMVDVILGVVWLVTRPKGKTRPCPVCGTDVKKGVTVCPSCGYNFATGAQPTPGTPPTPRTPTG